ncbi:MAG TPA: hypothetical protein ENI81_00335 [Phycisphaerales bacterium]|nr:hypothetical protein [Phycisphaerales bacterium]
MKLLRLTRKGAALPLAMVAVMLLLAMGVGLLNLGVTARIQAIRASSAAAARSAADSGLEMAMFQMDRQLLAKSLDDDNLPQAVRQALPNCNLVYSYTVRQNDGGGYDIECTGTAGGREKVVGCTLECRGPFEYAIFSKGAMELKNSCKVDWYNYDEDDRPMQIGTNSIAAGAVTLKNSAYVNGDVVVGVGGDPDVAVSQGGSSDITGDILVAPEEHELPEVTVPEWLDLLPSSGILKNDTTISSSAKYSGIDLKNSKTIEITGDVVLYVEGDIILGNSADIEIAEGASLTLYVGGNIEQKNSSSINNKTKDPKSLKIYGLDSCQNMDFKNRSEMYGAIYAPNADVVMHNSNKTYGAIVVKSLEWKNSSELHYDASLRDVEADDDALQFVMTNWYEQ